MNKKLFIFLSTFAFILSTISISFAQTNPNRVKTVVPGAQTTNSLAALLPASDGVINIDLKRLMNEALPQILSANPEMLNEINGKIADVQAQTGLDLRQFEQVVVGVAFKQISPKETDFAPLILARGKFNAGSLLALAKMAAKGKYREEKLGDKTVYIFSAQEVIQQNKPVLTNSTLGKLVDRALSSLKNEIAITVYDDNTIAIGTLPRMGEMFTDKTHIDSGVVSYLSHKPNAVISFGANTPNGLSQFFDLDNDEIGSILSGVRSLYGSLEMGRGNVSIAVVAKSADLQKAKDMEESVTGLQMIGKSFLGGAKGKDKEVYARMIDNAKISRKLTEVMLDLQVPQTDINILLGKK